MSVCGVSAKTQALGDGLDGGDADAVSAPQAASPRSCRACSCWGRCPQP